MEVFQTKRLTIPAAEELLGLYFPVLDHGYVALVDYMGGDAAIDQAARTSYGAGTRKVSERRGLLRTLKRNAHTSPYEMVELKFHCAMPIFVARQWVRHRTANLNEYSARYSVLPMLFYVPDQLVVGKQSVNNKQGRGAALDAEQFEQYLESVHLAYEAAQAEYEKQVRMGVARETARGVLPVTTYTQWYWKIDLHNLSHFLGLRCDAHAQLEIRVYADILAAMVKRLAPESFEAWVDYEFAGCRMSRMELGILRKLVLANLEDASIIPNPHGPLIDVASMQSGFGLSKREVDEFLVKLSRPTVVPSFDLDLAAAKSPEFFAEKWEKAVPTVDRVPA
jgi:thymidylate synthase (FAD)